jgi:hypothetical protein
MPGRRGKSEGSIRKRPDDRWEARYVDVGGKRQSIYGSSRQEVARLLNAALRERDQGLTALSSRQTVGDYLASWIAIYKQRRRLTSYERNERTVRKHLIPGLG